MTELSPADFEEEKAPFWWDDDDDSVLSDDPPDITLRENTAIGTLVNYVEDCVAPCGEAFWAPVLGDYCNTTEMCCYEQSVENHEVIEGSFSRKKKEGEADISTRGIRRHKSFDQAEEAKLETIDDERISKHKWILFHSKKESLPLPKESRDVSQQSTAHAPSEKAQRELDSLASEGNKNDADSLRVKGEDRNDASESKNKSKTSTKKKNILKILRRRKNGLVAEPEPVEIEWVGPTLEELSKQAEEVAEQRSLVTAEKCEMVVEDDQVREPPQETINIPDALWVELMDAVLGGEEKAAQTAEPQDVNSNEVTTAIGTSAATETSLKSTNMDTSKDSPSPGVVDTETRNNVTSAPNDASVPPDQARKNVLEVDKALLSSSNSPEEQVESTPLSKDEVMKEAPLDEPAVLVGPGEPKDMDRGVDLPELDSVNSLAPELSKPVESMSSIFTWKGISPFCGGKEDVDSEKEHTFNESPEKASIPEATEDVRESPEEEKKEGNKGLEVSADNACWKKVRDPVSGRYYYYNRRTRETSWFANGQENSVDRTYWKKARDPVSGRYYYYNRRTRETSWFHPNNSNRPQRESGKSILKSVPEHPTALPTSTKGDTERSFARSLLNLSKRKPGNGFSFKWRMPKNRK